MANVEFGNLQREDESQRAQPRHRSFSPDFVLHNNGITSPANLSMAQQSQQVEGKQTEFPSPAMSSSSSSCPNSSTIPVQGKGMECIEHQAILLEWQKTNNKLAHALDTVCTCIQEAQGRTNAVFQWMMDRCVEGRDTDGTKSLLAALQQAHTVQLSAPPGDIAGNAPQPASRKRERPGQPDQEDMTEDFRSTEKMASAYGFSLETAHSIKCRKFRKESTNSEAICPPKICAAFRQQRPSLKNALRVTYWIENLAPEHELNRVPGQKEISITGHRFKNELIAHGKIKRDMCSAMLMALRDSEATAIKRGMTSSARHLIGPDWTDLILNHPLVSPEDSVKAFCPPDTKYNVAQCRFVMELVYLFNSWSCYCFDFDKSRLTIIDTMVVNLADSGLILSHCRYHDKFLVEAINCMKLVSGEDGVPKDSWERRILVGSGPKARPHRYNTAVYALNTARWFNGDNICDPMRERIAVGSYVLPPSSFGCLAKEERLSIGDLNRDARGRPLDLTLGGAATPVAAVSSSAFSFVASGVSSAGSGAAGVCSATVIEATAVSPG